MVSILKNFCYIGKNITYRRPVLTKSISSPLKKKYFATMSTSINRVLPSFPMARTKLDNFTYSSSQAMGQCLKTSFKYFSQSILTLRTQKKLIIFANEEQERSKSQKPHGLIPNNVDIKGNLGVLNIVNPTTLINQIKAEEEVHVNFNALEKMQIWEIERKQARKNAKQEREQAR